MGMNQNYEGLVAIQLVRQGACTCLAIDEGGGMNKFVIRFG